MGAGASGAGAGALAAGAGDCSGAGAAAGGADEALFSAGGVLLHPQNRKSPTKLSNKM